MPVPTKNHNTQGRKHRPGQNLVEGPKSQIPAGPLITLDPLPLKRKIGSHLKV